MKKEIDLTEAITISKWYATENFKCCNRLCLGCYSNALDDEMQDEYQILIKWSTLFYHTKLFSYDKIVLRLFNLYNPQNTPQNIYIYKTQNNYTTDSVTWVSKPSIISNPLVKSIDPSISQKNYYDIDITSLIRTGFCSIEDDYSLLLKGDCSLANSIVYFDCSSESHYPQLILDLTPTTEVYAMFINDFSPDYSSKYLDPGNLRIGSKVSLYNTPLPDSQRVFIVDSPGIYNFEMETTSLDLTEGTLIFLVGEKNQNISLYKTAGEVSLKKLCDRGLNFLLSCKSSNQALALKLTDDALPIQDLTTIIKRISVDSTLKQTITSNPLVDVHSYSIDYDFYIAPLTEALNIGTMESPSFIKGDVRILGEHLTENNIILIEGVTIDGTLLMDCGSCNIRISKCIIKNLEVIQCNHTLNGLIIDTDSNIDTIIASNTKSIKIAVNSTFESTRNINNLILSSQAMLLSDSTVILNGNFGRTNISIIKSLNLILENFICLSGPKVDIKDSLKTLVLDGTSTHTEIYLLNSVNLVGLLSLTSISFFNQASDSSITLAGNFSDSFISLENTSNLQLLPNTSLGCLCCNATKAPTISLNENSSIKKIILDSSCFFEGSRDELEMSLKSVSITNTGSNYLLKNTSSIVFNQFVRAVNVLKKHFIEEIHTNISLESLSVMVHEISDSLTVNIYSLSPSEVFSLNQERNIVFYEETTVDINHIRKHEAILQLELTKDEYSFVFPICIKGKYKFGHIDYESKSLFLPDNADILNFALLYDAIEKIILIEDFIHDDSSLIFDDKDMYMDLNNFSVKVNRIRIKDSNIVIENGRIAPTTDLSKWNYSNERLWGDIYSFIRCQEQLHGTSLKLANISISLDTDLIVNPDMNSNTNAIIRTSCNNNNFSVKSLWLDKCNLSLTGSPLIAKDLGFSLISSTSLNTHITNSVFLSSGKYIILESATQSIETLGDISGNTFLSSDLGENIVLEIIPYTSLLDSLLLFNGIQIPPDLELKNLISKVLEIAFSMILNIPFVFESNYLEKGAWIYLWSNETLQHNEKIRYNGSSFDKLITDIYLISSNSSYLLSYPGDMLRLIPHFIPSDASFYDLNWWVSDSTMATVSSDGQVTAISEGLLEVWVKDLVTGITGNSKILISFGDKETPPEIYPQEVNNDLQHKIILSFSPTPRWSDSIITISRLSPDQRLLSPSEYIIDSDNGTITIINVIENSRGVPIYQEVLLPGSNIISIEASSFKDALVNQYLVPRQLIFTETGLASGIMNLSKYGKYLIREQIHSHPDNLIIEDFIEISVITVSPSPNSVNNDVDSLLEIFTADKIDSVDSNLITITDDIGFRYNITDISISSTRDKLTISHETLLINDRYNVTVASGCIRYVTGTSNSQFDWSFLC